MPLRFSVRGGRPLRGTVRPAGNKNAALPILAATLLAEGPIDLDNIPRIRDVETMLALLADLGASVEWTGPNAVRVDTTGARPKPLDPQLCSRIRASILLAGPLLARFGQVILPPPGGDVIGRRRVDTHFLALEQLGASVMVGDRYELEGKALRGGDIFLDEPSVTGTENALMAAVAAKGRTVLRNAASEPHVQDLARFLVALGAAHRRHRHQRVRHRRRPPAAAPMAYAIGPDHIEIGSFVGLAAVTNGEVTIDPVRPEDLRATLLGFDRLGIRPRLDGTRLIVDAGQERRIRPDLGGHVPKLEDGPWPAFPADLMSTTIVAATQCAGMLLVFEKMFESRLFFVDKLIGMGAQIVLCDPHRAVISGPARLKGGTVESPDIRAGMAMLLAALAAEGREHDPQRRPDRARVRAGGRPAPCAGRGDRAGGRLGMSERAAAVAEVPRPGEVPRYEIPGWRDRFGVVAGITARGAVEGPGFDLGLWTREPVADVMGRWRALRGAEPGFDAFVMAHQVHGSGDRRACGAARMDHPRGHRRSRHAGARDAAPGHGGRLHPRLSRGAAGAGGGAAPRRVARHGGRDRARGDRAAERGLRVASRRYCNALWRRYLRCLL